MDVFLQQLANGLVLGGAYTLVALGLYLVYSTLHIPNFAHGALYALGAYLQFTYSTVLGLPFFVAIGASVISGAAIGVLLERVVFRRLSKSNGFTILVGSLALAIVLQEVIGLIWGHDLLGVAPPFDSIAVLGHVRISSYRLAIIAIVVVAAIGLAIAVYRTTYGRSLRAIAQNREIAELSGVNVTRVTVITFAISGALASLGGALLAPTVTLEPHMGFSPTIVSFAILVVVGAGARLAAVVTGAFAVAILETFAAAYITNAARTAVVFVALVLFLIVRPEGALRSQSETKVRL
jgi:branched-chain amino acid transport system permease protein